MPPDKQKVDEGFIADVSPLMAAHLEDNELLHQRMLVAQNVARITLKWVDLPPELFPKPPLPPNGEEVQDIESSISPDKVMKRIFVMAGDEFSVNGGGFDRWGSFTNKEGNLVTIEPHIVTRYQRGGPVTTGIYGPVTAGFAPLYNASYPGQTWNEISKAQVDTYVSKWCTIRPSVTVIGVGIFDVFIGLVGWTPECVSPGIYREYYLEHLNLFINRARDYCRLNRIDFEGWYVHHKFVLLSIPSWVSLTEEMVSKYTISIKTWNKFRKICYKDMYPIQPMLWDNFRAVFFNPEMPNAELHTVGQCYLLGPKYSKLYIAQVLAAVARIICVRPYCQVPKEFRLMRTHLFHCPDEEEEEGKCGRYMCRFVPAGLRFQDLLDRGHC